MSDNRYAFDQFPRGRLVFTYTRRGLLTSFLQNVEVVEAQEQGQRTHTLADLGNWPDDELGEVTPLVVPGVEIITKDGFVWGQPPNTTEPICLFPIESPALIAFNLFNGLNFVSETSAELAGATGWDYTYSFAYTRGLFLSLVVAGICLPRF